MNSSRRDFLRLAAGTQAAFVLAAFDTGRAAAQGRPAPSCAEGALTPRQTAGPFFKPDSPVRASLLEPGLRGTRIVLTGTVLSIGCQPLPRAVLDFWQADDAGAYDNGGFRLRGHQMADDQGRYRLETIVPGAYVGRTRHIHVNVKPPDGPLLTTQLYFPGEAGNRRDSIFRPELVMQLRDTADGKTGTFDFVLDLAGRGRS